MVDASVRPASDDVRRADSALRVGLLLPGSPNRFFDKITSGVRSALLGDTPYQLLLALGEHTLPDETAAFEQLLRCDLDALIVVAARVNVDRLEAAAARLPLVMIGRHDPSTRYDTITGDDEAGARLAMTHLLDAGHTAIAHLTHEDVVAGVEPTTPHALRLWTYEQTLRERGLFAHARVIRCDSGEDSAYGAVRQALAAGDRPTAIFAAHDQLALGALRALAETRLARDDVEVVGYDNIKIAGHPLIALTTVDQEGEWMGRRAAELLLERLAGRTEPVHERAEVTLVVRSVPSGGGG